MVDNMLLFNTVGARFNSRDISETACTMHDSFCCMHHLWLAVVALYHDILNSTIILSRVCVICMQLWLTKGMKRIMSIDGSHLMGDLLLMLMRRLMQPILEPQLKIHEKNMVF